MKVVGFSNVSQHSSIIWIIILVFLSFLSKNSTTKKWLLSHSSPVQHRNSWRNSTIIFIMSMKIKMMMRSVATDILFSILFIFISELMGEFINGILLPKLFWPTVRKNCTRYWEKLLIFEADGWEFSKCLRSLEQFIQTVKCRNNFR